MNKSFVSWMVIAQTLVISDAGAVTSEPSRIWLQIPWEIRYLLFVDTAAGRAQDFQLAKRNNTLGERNGKQYVYLDVDELLNERDILATSTAPAIATSLLFFDAATPPSSQNSIT
jgi:hypothetical protein